MADLNAFSSTIYRPLYCGAMPASLRLRSCKLLKAMLLFPMLATSPISGWAQLASCVCEPSKRHVARVAVD